MNTKFNFEKTEIEGLFKITPFNAEDVRGKFTKDYSKEVFQAAGISHDIAEVFYATNKKGVIRGLHFQRIRQQPKLVRCICGHVWDVVVDLRKDSPTFKKWIGFDLTEDNNIAVLAPKGCAHGYIAIKKSVVSYKCAEKFYGEYDGGVYWADSELGIDWPLKKIGGAEKVILSEKDKALPSFKQVMAEYDKFI